MATLKDLIGSKTAVHCLSPEQWNAVTFILGYEWKASTWHEFKQQSVIALNMCACGTVDNFAHKGFTIITAAEFIDIATPLLNKGADTTPVMVFDDEVNTPPTVTPCENPKLVIAGNHPISSKIIFNHYNPAIIAAVLKRLSERYSYAGLTFEAGPGTSKPDLVIKVYGEEPILASYNDTLFASVGFFKAIAVLAN